MASRRSAAERCRTCSCRASSYGGPAVGPLVAPGRPAAARPPRRHHRQEIAPVFKALNALPIPWVESVDIANAVVFLDSDDARYITGVSLPVDAGEFVK
jgi:NAD(P)-dependent dehydrogenase (short-subunit alcohol dehydrogenase family)